METDKIKAILYAIECGSLSKAAEKFDYTPSALSHMADSIEQLLDVKILKRDSFGVTVTKSGELLLDKLRAVINAENELFYLAKNVSKNQSLSLNIGAYSSISQHILPEIVQNFKKEYPQVEVSIKVADMLLDWGDDVDVIFSDHEKVSGYESFPVMKDPYVAVVSNEFNYKNDVITKESLYDEKFIVTAEKLVNEYFDLSKFREKVSLSSIEYASVISMVKEGIGIAVLPQLAIKSETQVRALKLTPPLERNITLLCKKGVKKQSTLKFVKFVKKFYAI